MGTFRKAIFRNAQWEVTNCGVASLRTAAPYCCYQIDAERLLSIESFAGKQLYSWPMHVTRIAWVDPDLFFEAFKAAIDALEGQYSGRVDPALLEDSFDQAMRDAMHNEHATYPGRRYRPGYFRRSAARRNDAAAHALNQRTQSPATRY
jgi:hypothetical protein